MRGILPLLPRPSRYLGIEDGAVRKDPTRVDLHVGLAFPDLYEVAMSYLGQKILYGQMNARPDILAERAFAPCAEAGALLREHKTPLATLESGTPLKDLHVLAFSLTHELCYTNVLYMLDLAGIPLRTADRWAQTDDLNAWPLVIAGGGCTLAAEPMAPFFDLMALGDGEVILPELADLLIECRRKKTGRAAFIDKARRIPGVYVPELFQPDEHNIPRPLLPDYTRVQRRVAPDLDAAPYPVSQVIPFGAVHNRLALEIARGCTRGCRFCQAGMTYRPARERDNETLTRLLHDCLTATGFDDVSFLSLSTGDFSSLKSLFLRTVDRCAADQISVSLPSLRVGSIDDEIMARMAGIRRTGATLAPEAGSQRLRDVINKGVTEEDLLLHARKLFEHGWQQVKLYFMIGLPTETQEDLDAIVDLCRKVRDAAGPGVRRLQVTAAISPFVPKPHTPFQWERQISLAEIAERVNYLRDAFSRVKAVTMRWHDPKTSLLEGVFSRPDRRLAEVVEGAYNAGQIFTSWTEHFKLDPWLECLNARGLTPEEYTKERDPDAPLPWDHLEAGLSRAFLLRERERALAGKITDDCRYAACNLCGACDLKNSPSLLAPAGQPIANRTNLPQRDQEAHSPHRDEDGRVLRREPENAPPRLAQELTIKAGHFRIWYSKEDRAAFLSQLELQPLFERALRRAGIALTFSQGFHPLPLITFGRALPVGVSSQAEWLAVFLRAPMSAGALQKALGPAVLPGIRILSVEPLPLSRRCPQSQAEVFTLRYHVEPERLPALHAAWEAFKAAPNFLHSRATKSGEKESDIRPLFTDIRIQPDHSLTLAFDWSRLYVSPLVLARAVTPDAGIEEIDLCKIRQIF